ncbi:MAG: serine/threonine protein kinase [Fibrobacteres bacterium]|nr:serine/threonine protein kinase [Fibrobacterota bacterium]
MPEKVIRQIAQYSVIRPIGSGGMATVYEAVDERLGRIAALKILHPHLAADTSAVERFKREALSAAKLVHQNIVQVYDYIEQGGERCIALEFVPGTDAESVVKKSGGLGFKNTLAIMHPVAEALRLAHKHQMIHRDVKPSNIMIRPDRRVMLTDFGLVKGSLDINLTMDNTVAGTPAFMAPEQIAGKVILPSSDIYAWAVSFHFIITGSLPYNSTEFISIMSDIKAGKTAIDEKALSAMPGKYSAIIRRCLLPDPADRPKDASELLVLLGDLPVDVIIEQTICNPEECERVASAYATEKSIAKTVVGRTAGSKKSKYYATFTVVLLLIAVSFLFLKEKPQHAVAQTQPLTPLISDTTLLPAGNDTVKKRIPAKPANSNTRKQVISKTKENIVSSASALKAIDSSNISARTAEAAAEPVKIDSGAFFIHSEPWANVDINGRSVGKTPLGPIPYPVGRYHVRLYNEFTEEISDSITVKTGEVTRKRFKLTIKPAYRQ